MEFAEGGGEMALVAHDESRGAECGVLSAPPDEDETAQELEVGGGMARAGAGFVLEPGGIAGMVIFVFDAPTAANGPQRVRVGEWFAQDEHAPAGGLLACGLGGAVAFDFNQLSGVNEAELLRRYAERADVPLVEPAMARFEVGGKKGGASSASFLSARALAKAWLSLSCTRVVAPCSWTSWRTRAVSA